jgi:uncharacterized protein YkwD
MQVMTSERRAMTLKRRVLIRERRASGVIFAAVCAIGCGPIYKSDNPQPAPAADQSVGPPGGTDPWSSGASDPAADPAPTPSAPAPAPASRPAPEPAAGGSGSTAEPQAWVAAHNAVRARHCAAPLTWSPRLAAVAQQWADSLRDHGCKFDHSGGNFGENLARGTSGMLDPSAVVTMWYDEVKGYSFKQPGFSMQSGHFTQVVWRGTRQVGCGRSQCKGMDTWVCEYDPPGNWEGQYREQVLPVGCK